MYREEFRENLMDDMDMIFLFKKYLDETDLSFLEGADKALILTGDQYEVQGETLIIKGKGDESE